ncbi:MAG: ATP-binding protein [Syntrophobacteraceae bacterium]|nr:ATP-binding protein [Syntrophobacteraceae bacterium]
MKIIFRSFLRALCLCGERLPKSGPGRGLGAYSMKLFGEDILGGKVGFTSSEVDGTVFRFSLDIHQGALRP